MIAVIFQVTLKPQGKDTYLDIAASLKTLLAKQPGFISIERFISVSNPCYFLSLSFWQDEQAILRWREQLEHKQAQEKGKTELFEDFRLRVAHVSRDYGMGGRQRGEYGTE
ncbi:antibiotic biosynthesis monooxygenase [Pseudoalteromonas sp. Of7M-16]|uniref:antibiotic biosynthesis monooxygenase family protein n=1 Tax=Pseudoalteromonas sp. Of7M-16 TaxID=2917756 RepID=UPI001EF64620|nr:antibiotic biosynthesis monooxygenase [Pseudoalteromonas sp. Of7M-16]MCG7547870.1 antibiotic biosynthesis monooxygenase [Pseudoalteromonas sp. Of7M-16]